MSKGKKRALEFLRELAELTEKYQVEIRGCGCCGSPFVRDLKNGNKLIDHIIYDSKERRYMPYEEYTSKYDDEE